jgi:uncharacterized phiE125 gp8 family phage protein
MDHRTTVQPATEPVTLAEMRQHLGISDATDTSRDAVISARITSARLWAEDYTRKRFITQTVTAYGTDFPFTPETGYKVELKGPLQSVTSVKYLDTNGTQQTLSSILYIVDLVNPGLVPAYAVSWPVVRAQPNAVEIAYIAGYGNAAAVPEPIKDAIRFIIGQWEVFQNSIEGVVRPFTIPNAAKQLLDNYVDYREWF